MARFATENSRHGEDVVFYQLGHDAHIRLTEAAARGFREILNGQAEMFTTDGLNPKPLGYFEYAARTFYLEGAVIYEEIGKQQKVWTDDRLKKMYKALANNGFTFSPIIFGCLET